MPLRISNKDANNTTAASSSSSSSASTSRPAGRTKPLNGDGQRHGSSASSGADSWRSTDTVRGPFGSTSSGGSSKTPMKTSMNRKPQLERDAEPSSTTIRLPESSNARSNIAPWEDDPPSNEQQGNHRQELSVLQGSGNIPSIHRQPPPAGPSSPWPGYGNSQPRQPATVLSNNFYDDSSESQGQISPGFAPPGAFPMDSDDRRPSIASATTVSSTGSRASTNGRMSKKVAAFFGDDYLPTPQDGSRQNSESSLMLAAGRHRNNSLNDAMLRSGPPSPTSSRPRTPIQASGSSNEVTPWIFQDEAGQAGRHSHDQSSSGKSSKHSFSHHRLHLPRHRHNRSNEEKQFNNSSFPLRPSTSREQSFSTLRRGDASPAIASAFNLKPRASSPTPSAWSTQSSAHMSQRSPSGREHKRSLFDRVTGRHRHDKPSADTLHSQSTTSLTSSQGQKPSRNPRPEIATSSNSPTSRIDTTNGAALARKESRLPFKTKRTDTFTGVKNPRDVQIPATDDGAALWQLDTDMSRMEGIVDRRQPPATPPAGEIYTGQGDQAKRQPVTMDDETGGWDAPDSWAVKKVTDENVARLREANEEGNVLRDDDPGPMFFMRIFRADSTFAVISASLNTTAAELISMMAKKTFLQDELDNYQIVMRKQDTSRQLEAGERPLVMQKRLLEMAGWTDADRLEDLGREDHGYLCRFTFLPAKMSGYSSLERDPGFNRMQRFNHIDLAGRNLVTIPIALYQKATEIITLNLSRNLTLDIPKDFIQSCTQLREIKYTSNEAWRVPASLPLALKLTMLDISNNRFEQLDHTELWKLSGLISVKLSNNLLTGIPDYFGRFRAMRSLNLSSNSLSTFPDALRDLTTLVDLDVSFNSISSLGDVGGFVNLERLWATNNKLSGALDESFRRLANLKEIDARFNALSNIDIVSELPKLELLMLGHNSVSQFEGTFSRLKILYLNHNPVTRFDLSAPVPTLSVLNLASAKLSQLPDALFSKMTNLTKLTISKNHFSSLSPNFGFLSKLEYLSIAKNELNRMPAEIGRLAELRYLDVRENNLDKLPPEIWYAKRLETLNVSSNVLADFPKPGAPPPAALQETTPQQTPTVGTSPDFEELGKLEDFQLRRPSQASGMLSISSSPGTNSRKGSVVSYASSTKTANLARTGTGVSTIGTITPSSRKDSTLSGKLASTFATTLRHLFLADNRLEDDVFHELGLLPELRILNVSYNQLYDIPPRTIKRWTHLTELYLSGNDLSALPAEDLEEGSSLKVLHINNNRFQVLPAELGKVQKLAILDVGSNTLKYNVSNWPYDWNWNWNHQLRYLNLSGNKRLEIKPSSNASMGRETRDLTDFSSLSNLRILGLMDVTLTIPSVPDQGSDRRVRTAGSIIGTSMPYGMADTLGRNEHLSTLDMVVPRFRGHEDETLIGLFDGQSISTGGSRIAKYLHEKFKHHFLDEMERKKQDESPSDALRRTYLGLNKELATAATQVIDAREHPSSALVHRNSISGPDLSEDDLSSGSVATVMFLQGMDLFVSNVGDAQALLIQSEGGHRIITRKHDPAEAGERQRIRDAGGFVSRQGKLNDQLDVSRAFGYVQLSPCVIAAPNIMQVKITESDETILLASRELWDYLTPDFAVDVARSERGDLMRAAQKLRDLAIAFGATGKIMVMMIGVSDLRKRERARFRTHSMSMGPSSAPDDYFSANAVRKPKRGREAVGDSKLARLDQEVDAPIGDVTLVFTDIKNSTILWETYRVAMRSAIRMHNELMRRHLRIIGGYEVKTEGDAFMVAFPTVTSALLWCFTMQSQLLEVQWPQEILNSVHGEEVQDADGNVIFRGLSVRMGIHWGRPDCEVDPVTKRMDYFGPIVNRAARIEGVADGGQICVSADFIAEVQRLLESHIETDRSGSTGSEETLNDDLMSQAIRRELRLLSSQGFEVKDLGPRTLKGLENPEYIYLMYPHSLASRLLVQQQKAEAEARQNNNDMIAKGGVRNTPLTIDTQNVWDLWSVSLRLEMLCSALESSEGSGLKPPETALLERMKQREGEITDRFLVNFVEHQISRIETCVSTLALRNMIHPFSNNMLRHACPMGDILNELSSQLKELHTLRQEAGDHSMAPS